MNSCLVVISTCCIEVTVSLLLLAIWTSPRPLSVVPNLAPPPLDWACCWSAKASGVPGRIPLLCKFLKNPDPRAFLAPLSTNWNWVPPEPVSTPFAPGAPKRAVSLWPAALLRSIKNAPEEFLLATPSVKESTKAFANSLFPLSMILPAPLDITCTRLLSTTPVFSQLLSPCCLVSIGAPIFRSVSVLPAKFSSHAFHWIALQPSASGGYKSMKAW